MDESDAANVPDMSLLPDTVPVVVSGDGIQLCPALILGSPQAIPGAAKHIYSRLAAAASEVDQGVPDLIISLVSHGNSLSTKYMSIVEQGLKSFITGCGTWIISSGDVDDPLSRIASATFRNTLPQLEHSAEVLHVLVNSDEIIATDSSDVSNSRRKRVVVVDTSLNTLMILCRTPIDDEHLSISDVRAAVAVRLAHPPPALLIGVPSEPMSSSNYGASSAAILLSPSNDKRPFPVTIFAGASRESLNELLLYIEHGIPVIILQDSCELCSLLHSSSLLLETSGFEHEKFVEWLKSQLNTLGLVDAHELITNILVKSSSAGVNLLEFIDAKQIPELSSIIVDRCLECYATNGEERQVLLLAAKLNSPSVLSAMDVATQLDEELLTMILCECITKDDQLNFLSSVLQLNPPIRVTSNMLIKMMHHADEHFFTTIVLCQCMGYSYLPSEIDPCFANDIQKLVKKLSNGVDNLFDPNVFCNDMTQRDNDESLRILAIWSLLLHRPGVVKCLAAFADEPVAFSLILSRISRSLAHESHDWYFYEKSLIDLSSNLSANATTLFDSVFKQSPAKAYKLLCQPMEHFYGFNMTQLAYHCNARDIIAHECCQRWVHRKLYGNLQAKKWPIFLPKWIKFVISAILIFPIRFWMLIRPKNTSKHDNGISPTVTLLDVGRVPQKQRAISTYSVISSRSEALTALTAPLSTAFGLNSALGGADSATPQSMVFPLNIEDVDSGKPFIRKNRIRRAHPPSISAFYSTPIVKYWLSLLFRLVYICCLAYTVIQPGCGSNVWDTAIWTWSFFWWIENLLILVARSQKIPMSLMPWRVFDVLVFFIFLVMLLVMKVFPIFPLFEFLNIQSIYAAKVVSGFFMLYVSYSTLFTYIPLSDIFGPMIIRVKLMLLRDFFNFLFMISLVMLSSAVAIQAIVFPDRYVTYDVLRSTLSWIWLSLFTTDLSHLSESESCRKTFLGAPKQFCSNVGQYANPTCPTQSPPAYLVIIEYFVILKLLLWPILFAFFAKTAKSVDDEADKIWRFQLYSLAEDFRLRPALPPPLTILCILCSACCRISTSNFTRILAFDSFDHPDFEKSRNVWRGANTIYRNPSVPFKRNEFLNFFWRKLAIENWKFSQAAKCKEHQQEAAELHNIQNYIRMMALRDSYDKSGSQKPSESHTLRQYPNTEITIREISYPHKSWNVLVPRYNPPFYCKPLEQFPSDVQKYVDVATEQNIGELKRIWRGRQANDIANNSGKCWKLSAAGFPLNPNGRTGLAGRGNHPRFGANRKCFYIIICGGVNSTPRVLIDERKNIPNEWHLENSSKDEHLTSLLKMIGISDSDAHMFSMRRLDSSIVPLDKRIPSTDTSPAHLGCQVVENRDDTDNAWTEHDVWAISLRDRRILASIIGYSWIEMGGAQATLPKWHADLVLRAKTIYGF